ncbi:hypothetical protein EVAR_91446_1 [Eumeta japonica]|uniref:Uncharacterized protein n=1 Tax=Eumeta variegata TaxID=151549 RepID=A0A4C1X374_EUMVA|nr:hypothetical protein EVAR_91446_1 [Eumeta japonica]
MVVEIFSVTTGAISVAFGGTEQVSTPLKARSESATTAYTLPALSRPLSRPPHRPPRRSATALSVKGNHFRD